MAQPRPTWVIFTTVALEPPKKPSGPARAYLFFLTPGGSLTHNNDTIAVHWSRLAADQGDATAQWFLGECFSHGTGTAIDAVAAAGWYRLAADQGYVRERTSRQSFITTPSSDGFVESAYERRLEEYRLAMRPHCSNKYTLVTSALNGHVNWPVLETILQSVGSEDGDCDFGIVSLVRLIYAARYSSATLRQDQAQDLARTVRRIQESL
jgi:hypothetical protein